MTIWVRIDYVTGVDIYSQLEWEKTKTVKLPVNCKVIKDLFVRYSTHANQDTSQKLHRPKRNLILYIRVLKVSFSFWGGDVFTFDDSRHDRTMDPTRLPRIMIHWKPEGRKQRGRPRRTWKDGIYTATNERDLRKGEWNIRRQ